MLRAIDNETNWHKWRESLIGASEVGALFGVHDYKTYYSLYHEKRGLLKTEQTKAMRDGQRMQPVALKMLQEQFPELKVYDPKVHYSNMDLGVGATPDAFAEDERGLGVIQIKWVRPRVFRQYWWSIDGELVPPLWIALQVIQEAWLTEAKWGKVAALVNDDDGLTLHLAEVEIRQDVIEQIKKEVIEFWRRVKEDHEPTPDYRRDGEVIRAVYRVDDGSEIDLTADNELPELVRQRALAKELAKRYEKDARAIDDELLHKLGDHAIGRFNGGYVSAKTINRSAYEVKATSYRQLRVVEK